MNLTPQFIYRFNFAKEDFKKSVCRQVDDLFASFLDELTSTYAMSALPDVQKLQKTTSTVSSLLPPLPLNQEIERSIQEQAAQAIAKKMSDALEMPINKASRGVMNRRIESIISTTQPLMISNDISKKQVKSASPPRSSSKAQSTSSSLLKNKQESKKSTSIFHAEHIKKEEITSDEDYANDEEEDCECSSCNGHQFDDDLPDQHQKRPLEPHVIPGSQKRVKTHSLVSSISASTSLLQQHPSNYNSNTASSSNTSSSSNGDRRYLCSVASCGKSFTDSYMLTRHKRIHNGTKPYCCVWPGCKQQCSQECNLLKHVRMRHLGLPETIKRQQVLGIVDNRDPKLFMRVLEDLL